MSKIKELKNNPENCISLVDFLELFSPEKKSKYTDTVLRIMKETKNLKDYVNESKLILTREFSFITMDDLDKFTDVQILLIGRFIDSFFNYSDLRQWRQFCEYNERGLISQNDLTKYKNFDDITNQLSIAEMKIENKSLEKEVVKLMDTDEWLVVRPLTYYSSKKYGSNTKWCTTSEGNPEYFLKYSKKGVLIYCINKLTGYKVASFYSLDKNDPEFSFWNQKDSRIDSLDTELTDEIRKLIQDVSKSKDAKTNRFLLSDELREKEETQLKKYQTESIRPISEAVEAEVPSPMQEAPVEMEMPALEDFIRVRNEERAVREQLVLNSQH